VFVEGPSGGSLYCPDFADVVIRDPRTWAEQPVGVLGPLPGADPPAAGR
jgi:hypothetical protein